MSVCFAAVVHAARRAALGVLVGALVLACCASLEAQQFLNQRSVGGVIVLDDGVLTNATVDARGNLQRIIAEALAAVPAGLDQTAGMRKVSLRRLDDSIRECLKKGEELPDAVHFLGGLQQIRYVLVYPEQHDIVLVGPGEGWKVNRQGAVVGVTTGRPVILLDDLLVALRSANAPNRSVISCSIDPTQEGLQRLRGHVKKLRTIGNPRQTAMGIERQLGPQQISVTGVPDTSHFARVMVAADYRMKRVAMDVEPAPIRGLPSVLAMMRASGSGMRNTLPRWWLAPNYQPLLRDPEGLAWELRGAAVKAMTEDDYLNAAGVREHTGRADPISQRWADIMTDRYQDLALADPVFGQLQNCMDLAIVGALIVRQDLAAKAGATFPSLLDSAYLKTAKLPAPKRVDSSAGLAHKGRKWMIACGGVQINPWAIVENAEQSDSLRDTRSESAAADPSAWCWD